MDKNTKRRLLLRARRLDKERKDFTKDRKQFQDDVRTTLHDMQQMKINLQEMVDAIAYARDDLRVIKRQISALDWDGIKKPLAAMRLQRNGLNIGHHR